MRLPIAVGVAVAGLLLAADAAASQAPAEYAADSGIVESGTAAVRWSFGPTKPHLVDAVKRTAYGFTGGAILMAIGLGFDQLNALQCTGTMVCSSRNTVQTGLSFAFLGAVSAATRPELSSKCKRSGRAIFGILGAVIGVSAASTIADVRLLNAGTLQPATFRTMSTGLLGLSIGAGVATAIC